MNKQAFQERRIKQVCVTTPEIIELLEWRRLGYVTEVCGDGIPPDTELLSVHFDNCTFTFHLLLCSPNWEPAPEGKIVECALDASTSPYFRRKIIRGSEDEWHLIDDKSEIERLRASEETAWGIIANAYGGDWDQASEASGWKKAAEEWRDAYRDGAVQLAQSERTEYGIVGGVTDSTAEIVDH